MNLQREPNKDNSYRLPLLCSDLFYQALFEDIKPHKLGQRGCVWMSRKREKRGSIRGKEMGEGKRESEKILNTILFKVIIIIIIIIYCLLLLVLLNN